MERRTVTRVGLHPVVVVVLDRTVLTRERLQMVVVRMVRGIHQRHQMYRLTQAVVVVVLVTTQDQAPASVVMVVLV